MKFILTALLLPFLFLSCNMHEGGVRTTNNMEKYAIDYITNNKLLQQEEKIAAYYDYTISLDGSESVLLTDSRLIYHNEDTSTTTINITDIIDIQHRKESLVGDIIEVMTENGDVMMIEIAPLNQGETFLKVLNAKVKVNQ